MRNNCINNFVIFFLFISLFFCSCKNKSFDSEKELEMFISKESNGYVYHKTVNGVSYSLAYRPTDLLAMQEIYNKENVENASEELKKKYSKYIYFNLSMSKSNQELLNTIAKNRNDFGNKVKTLVFDMSEKVNLITGNRDTLSLSNYIYPRMYGMSKSTSMMFVYPRDEKLLESKYCYFTIEDFGLQTGEIRFKIETSKIKNEPNLSFKN